MNKLLTVIAATLLAVTAIASGAEAGFNVRIKAPADFSEVHKAGCGGGGGASRVYRRASIPIGSPLQAAGRGRQPHRLQAGRRGQGRDRSAGSRADRGNRETSPRSRTRRSPPRRRLPRSRSRRRKRRSPRSRPRRAEQKVATAGDLGCKTFFASVGMTLSRPLRTRSNSNDQRPRTSSGAAFLWPLRVAARPRNLSRMSLPEQRPRSDPATDGGKVSDRTSAHR